MEKAYYLGPDKGGARAYRLLAQALRKTDRAALAKYAARGKEYLDLVRAAEDGLLMEQLHYAEEIRPFSEVPVGEVEVKEEELRLAVHLIEQAASDKFLPEKYKDSARERILELIQRKVDGEDITVTLAYETEHKIIDLMEALKASIAASGGAALKRKPTKRAMPNRPWGQAHGTHQIARLSSRQR